MRQPIAVAPSILSADFSDMGRAIRQITEAGADLVHCDVMDGLFVPNITFGFKMIEDIKRHTRLPLDVHLMIVEPERYTDRFCDAGADYLTFHIEAAKNAADTLKSIRKKGVKPGIVISPDTPADAILDVLHLCDIALVMSVHPGFGGQSYIDSATGKLRQLRDFIDREGLNTRLEVDGGITQENVGVALSAGADTIVAGSAVFNAKDMRGAIESLKG